MLGVGSSIDTLKVVVIGDGNVGKTCMLRRFVRGDFVNQYKTTIGAEFMEKDLFLRSSNSTVKLMLWDTAGQEIFNSLTQAYYRGAGAAIITFSTVDKESFANTEAWKERVEAVCGPITMVLCQTKFDLAHEAAVTKEEAEAQAERLEMPLFRVSSKDDFNVTQLFEFTTEQCLRAAARGTASGGEGGAAAAIPAADHPSGKRAASSERPDAIDTTKAAEKEEAPRRPSSSAKGGRSAAQQGGNANPSRSRVNLRESSEKGDAKQKKKFKCSLQ